MIPDQVTRPTAPDKKISTSNDFEFCYLRHRYLRRVKYNPTEAEMRPYMKIVENLTRNTFFVYYNLFKSVGMYQDDVLNIGRVHLVSFLGLYDLNKMEKKKEKFADDTLRYKYRVAEEKDFEQKNKANFTMFFKQRMEDLVRVCRQKVRNIKGQPSEEYSIFCGRNSPPKHPRELLKNYQEMGYRKIDFPTFKAIRKRSNVNNDATMFKFGGNWYIAILLDQRALSIDDIVGSGSNPYENEYNLQPDELYENLPIRGSKWNTYINGEKEQKDKKFLVVAQEKELKHFSKLFNKKSDYRKRVILQSFIAKNKEKTYYKEEVKAARKLLSSLGGWIR